MQPSALEWVIGIAIGWVIVATSLLVIGRMDFDAPPPPEDRVVIHASPRPAALEEEPPPPPPGGEPAQPKQKKQAKQVETPPETKRVEERKEKKADAKAWPDPVPVPMPPSDTEAPPPEPGGQPGGEPGGTPGGTPGGEGDGPTDEEKQAIAAYKRQIARFIQQHYSVTGTGLDSDELAKRKVRATVTIDADLNIVDYNVQSSGFEAFDNAARAALEAVKGKKLPPPPPGFTGDIGTKLNVTLICRPGQCD